MTRNEMLSGGNTASRAEVGDFGLKLAFAIPLILAVAVFVTQELANLTLGE